MERVQGKSVPFECLSHRAEERISPSLMLPRDVLYMNVWLAVGWKDAVVITSVSSSMFVGLISTKSARTGTGGVIHEPQQHKHVMQEPRTERGLVVGQLPQVDPQVVR